MKKIVRKYAIIFIDEKGETLKEESFTTKDMVMEFYNNPGPLQWNTYLVVPRELFKSKSAIEKFERNEDYTRKHDIEKDKINLFLRERFPKVKKDQNIKGSVKLIKGEDWDDARLKANDFYINHSCDGGRINMVKSWYRDHSSGHSLIEMDKLRSKIIKDLKERSAIYTHLDEEYFLLKKKFHFLLDNEDESERKPKHNTRKS